MQGRKSPIYHGTEVVINKAKLKKILDERGFEYIELHRKLVDKFKLDITYKGFMTLLANKSTWKLLYAWAIIDVLELNMVDIFEFINVDVEQKAKEKELWKEKYKNN